MTVNDFWLCDTWHMTGDTRNLTPDTWHLTPDTWHVTPEAWFLFFSFFYNFFWKFFVSGATNKTGRQIQCFKSAWLLLLSVKYLAVILPFDWWLYWSESDLNKQITSITTKNLVKIQVYSCKPALLRKTSRDTLAV